jgi:4-amino-4-deoxy-L-arabinose transferase-like glycosyltransferase
MRRPPLVVLVVGALAFANAATWALVTPAFEAPDEEAHVAYADHLAQTGGVPDSTSGRPFASEDLRLALGVTHHYSVISAPKATRPPWRKADEQAYLARLAAHPPRRDDGGGNTGASSYAPLFYTLPAGAAWVSGGSVFDRLLAMRLACALLAGIAAAFVCASVRELLPGIPWAAPAAGLLVAFQSMFGFIGGSVNPDSGAAAAGAALLYLLMRALRRGLTPWIGVGIGLTLVLGAVVKLNVLALAPAVVLAIVILLKRHGVPPRALVALVGATAATLGGWLIYASQLGRDHLPGAEGQAVLPYEAVPPQPVGLDDRLFYLWQIFLPPLPFMEDVYTGDAKVPAFAIYVQRGFASFGGTSLDPAVGVLKVIALAVALTLVLLAVAAWRERRAVWSRRGEIAVLLVAFLVLAVASHWNFARAQPEPYVLEQGRYLFPAATSVAVAAVGACFAFGRRWAPVMGTAYVAGTMVFSGLCQLFVFTSYYT